MIVNPCHLFGGCEIYLFGLVGSIFTWKLPGVSPRIREVVTSESDAVLKALTGKVSQEEQDGPGKVMESLESG